MLCLFPNICSEIMSLNCLKEIFSFHENYFALNHEHCSKIHIYTLNNNFEVIFLNTFPTHAWWKCFQSTMRRILYSNLQDSFVTFPCQPCFIIFLSHTCIHIFLNEHLMSNRIIVNRHICFSDASK